MQAIRRTHNEDSFKCTWFEHPALPVPIYIDHFCVNVAFADMVDSDGLHSIGGYALITEGVILIDPIAVSKRFSGNRSYEEATVKALLAHEIAHFLHCNRHSYESLSVEEVARVAEGATFYSYQYNVSQLMANYRNLVNLPPDYDSPICGMITILKELDRIHDRNDVGDVVDESH